MICKEAIPLIHEYLDGDLTEAASLALRQHLLLCSSCKKQFRQLEQTVALVRMGASTLRAPDQVTTKIMLSLPPVQRKAVWTHWGHRHPAASVAAVFAVVFLASYLSLWNADTQLMVRGNDLSAVVIEGDTVVIPSGRSVAGDLMVENGEVRVDGEVTGSLFVVDGNVVMASTAHVGGEIRLVDQWLEWIWYKMNRWFDAVSR